MKHQIVAGLTLLSLVSCTEFSTMYQPGKTKTERNVDQAQCNRFAADTNPPHIVTDWVPVFDSEGNYRGSRPESYDINEGRRHTAARNCMLEKGYQRVTIPYCKDEQIAGRAFAPIEVAPQISPNICGIRTDTGRVLIDLSKPI